MSRDKRQGTMNKCPILLQGVVDTAHNLSRLKIAKENSLFLLTMIRMF